MQLTFQLRDLCSARFWRGTLRAFGGALVFSLPMLMTMEMWWIGFHIEPLSLLLLVVSTIPLLVGLSRVVGFRETETLLDDVVDAFVACAVGAVAAAVPLWLFGVLKADMPLDEVLGKITVQAVPGSIGALLAQSQLGHDEKQGEIHVPGGYFVKEFIIMTAGALLLSLNVAPTEEAALVAYQMTPGMTLLLALLTLAIMQVFARGAARDEQDAAIADMAPLPLFLRYTSVAYAIALLMSVYILWVFGHLDGVGLENVPMMAVVQAFPAGIGAAGARLIL